MAQPSRRKKRQEGQPLQKHGISHVIYIVAGAMATGGAAWGVYDLFQSKNDPESPAKP